MRANRLKIEILLYFSIKRENKESDNGKAIPYDKITFNWGKKKTSSHSWMAFQRLCLSLVILLQTVRANQYCPGDNTMFGHNPTLI